MLKWKSKDGVSRFGRPKPKDKSAPTAAELALEDEFIVALKEEGRATMAGETTENHPNPPFPAKA